MRRLARNKLTLLQFLLIACILFCFTSTSISTFALVIRGDGFGGDSLIFHIRAKFSSSTNAEGTLFLADSDCCTLSTETGVTQSQIWMIPRGNCSFFDKAINAERNGAAGIIFFSRDVTIGDNFILATAEENTQLPIPIVYILSGSALALSNYLSAAHLNSSLPPLRAIIDENAEVHSYDAQNQFPSFKHAALMLLILPIVWCGFVSGHFCWRIYAERSRQQANLQRLHELPVVQFRALPSSLDTNRSVDALSSEHFASINDNCAVCLEEFTEDERVTILPCHHGYHRACIEEWLRKQSCCPICKAPLSSNDH